MSYRRHQVRLEKYIREKGESHLPLRILAHVVPGGGKSWLPGIIHQHFPHLKIGWFVPRVSLKVQAHDSLRENFGIVIRDSGNDYDPCRGHQGFVTTHAALMEQPGLWEAELARGEYLLVVDELHHAACDTTYEPEILARALTPLRYHIRLDMTGTLHRWDRKPIFGIDYVGRYAKADSDAYHLIRYSRADALTDEAGPAIVPIEFHHYDGPVQFSTSEGLQPELVLSEAKGRNESRAIFTALQTRFAEELFERGLEHWREHGRANGGKLLIVVADQASAREYAKGLRSIGVSASLAITDNESAHAEVEEFRSGPNEALVTCAMAYEGLDVPACSHIVCLTHIRSAPWIEQMLARAWRATDTLPWKDRCYAFVPNDRRMQRTIDRIREETPEMIAEPGTATGSGDQPEREMLIPIAGEIEEWHRRMLDADFTPSDSNALRQSLASFLSSRGYALPPQ